MTTAMPAPICRELMVLSLEEHADPAASGGALFTMRLSPPGWKVWLPGQFVMVRPRDMGGDLLWARPFSISRANGEELRIVFQVAGRGTARLKNLRTGDIVDVWGPLGNGFAVSREGPTVLLAGGVGLAPFVGYIESHPAPETLRLEFGHRLPVDCYPFADCTFIEAHSHLECGPKDLACFLNVLEEGIQEVASKKGLALACGPMPFLRSVQNFAAIHGARAQLSLETRMACGVGACLGCVVKASLDSGEQGEGETAGQGPVRPAIFHNVQTCTRGPIFWADQLDLGAACA